jgi:hypothetical protein
VPTARELLEQADALMRKNRGRADSDIPVLTDAITVTPSQLHVPAADMPLLTERVEDRRVVLPSLPGPPAGVASNFEGDPSEWLVMDTIDPTLHSVTGSAPDTLAVVPPVTLKTPDSGSPSVEFDLPTRATHKAAGSAPTPPPTMSSAPDSVASPAVPEYSPSAVTEQVAPPAFENPQPADDEHSMPPQAKHAAPRAIEYAEPPEPVPPPISGEDDYPVPAPASDERWRVLSEQISMQVLQRIDLFTDTGLKEQLARHLQPIVDRASAELVGEINDQVGKLVRSYVAEAIEREIAQWRSEHR